MNWITLYDRFIFYWNHEIGHLRSINFILHNCDSRILNLTHPLSNIINFVFNKLRINPIWKISTSIKFAFCSICVHKFLNICIFSTLNFHRDTFCSQLKLKMKIIENFQMSSIYHIKLNLIIIIIKYYV